MDANQKSAFELVTVTVGLCTVFIAVIIWFIFMVQSGLEKVRLKHETCMVETTSFVRDGNPATTVTQYCEPKGEPVQ
jgi:hypothetical protein